MTENNKVLQAIMDYILFTTEKKIESKFFTREGPRFRCGYVERVEAHRNVYRFCYIAPDSLAVTGTI